MLLNGSQSDRGRCLHVRMNRLTFFRGHRIYMLQLVAAGGEAPQSHIVGGVDLGCGWGTLIDSFKLVMQQHDVIGCIGAIDPAVEDMNGIIVGA